MKHFANGIDNKEEIKMSYIRNIISIKFLLVILLCSISILGQAKEPELEALRIKNSDGVTITYNVEIARSSLQMKRGLMFRDYMPENQGMLFIYNLERVATMWMKNTILSLDMLFIDMNGVIVNFAENTTPFSLSTISSGQPVIAVLELNAGQIQLNQFEIGDQITHSLFIDN
jgi:uncharacterized membrane protein (UPF0127 family)